VYHTVTIGTKVWMVENLKTTKYRDGSLIPNVTDNTQWRNLTTGAYCNYNNDIAIGAKYGKLYNWYAVDDIRSLAPVGWHIASDAEWTTLEIYVSANLGTSGSVTKSLASKTDWSFSTEVGSIGNDLTKNNATGFTGLSGGYRFYDGTFLDIGFSGSWWSSTEYDTTVPWYRFLIYDHVSVSRNFCIGSFGFSVRCVKD